MTTHERLALARAALARLHAQTRVEAAPPPARLTGDYARLCAEAAALEAEAQARRCYEAKRRLWAQRAPGRYLVEVWHE